MSQPAEPASETFDSPKATFTIRSYNQLTKKFTVDKFIKSTLKTETTEYSKQQLDEIKHNIQTEKNGTQSQMPKFDDLGGGKKQTMRRRRRRKQRRSNKRRRRI